MFMKEVSKATGLTKKAIEYYIEQGIICPIVLENGYRKFNESDISALKKIYVLRKLGIGLGEIKAVLTDKTGNSLHHLSVQKELDMQNQKLKNEALDKLIQGYSYEAIADVIKRIEQNATITEKLLEAFPGYYGRLVCLHFGRFLKEPITTADQQAAYGKIVSFLDGIPPLNLPEELKDYLFETTKHISTQQIFQMLESTKKSMENPDDFIKTNKEILEQYLEYKKSEEYKNSLAAKFMELMKQFNSASGYNDVFLPAMRQLSHSYREYFHSMEIANEKFMEQFPQIQTTSGEFK